MLNNKIVEELSGKLGELMASGPARDFEKNARALLAQALTKLDLVTREEFEVQQQLLVETRQKLAALEVRVSALEAARQAVTE